MQCIANEFDDDGDICVWGTDDEFFCGHALGGPPDPCGGITSESTCNATVSDLTNDRCVWVEETILANGSPSCEGSATQGRCVWVEEASDCSSTERCPSDDVRVLWRDLGAGTVAVASFDCGFQPYWAEGYENCDLSGIAAIPLVCACGCD